MYWENEEPPALETGLRLPTEPRGAQVHEI